MIELLILYVLLKRDLTMYAVQKHILDIFSPFTSPSFGALKPGLNRLEQKGCITSRKMMSDGGKLSVYYSLTNSGKNELKRLLLEELSVNPAQFFSNARLKLCCADILSKDEKSRLFFNIKSTAVGIKSDANAVLSDEYKHVNFYQKIILDNTVCELSNFITIVEGLEKDNDRNS